MTTFEYMERLHPFSLRLPEGLLAEIDRISDLENRSRAQVVIMALRDGIRNRVINGGRFSELSEVQVQPKKQNRETRQNEAQDKEVVNSVRSSQEKASDVLAAVPGIKLGSEVFANDDLLGGPAKIEMCGYKEFDQESGEWYGCRLGVHGVKVKHQRGEVIK